MLIDREAALVIKTITNTAIEISEKEEKIDMCKAIDDMQLTGTSEELFNIYRRSGDKQAVKDLFLFFTDISFDEYLQKCIEETASLAVADLKS